MTAGYGPAASTARCPLATPLADQLRRARDQLTLRWLAQNANGPATYHRPVRLYPLPATRHPFLTYTPAG